MMIIVSRDVSVSSVNMEDVMSSIGEREPLFVLFLGKPPLLLPSRGTNGRSASSWLLALAPLFGSDMGNKPALPWYF